MAKSNPHGQQLSARTSVAIAGVGLVCLGGLTARQSLHAVLGEGVTPTASPFLEARPHPDDEVRVNIQHLPCLGAWTSLRDRLVSMALAAADEGRCHATVDGPVPFEGRIGVTLVLPAPRDDLTEEVLVEVASLVAHELGAVSTARFVGDTGTFQAIRQASEWISSGVVDGVLLVAVDSLISPTQAALRVTDPPSFWRSDEPPPSEGAAALLLLDPTTARSLGSAMAKITSADTSHGTATENDEVIIDGIPMTGLMWDARAFGPFSHVLGQEITGLRRREWELAICRVPGVYAEESVSLTIESVLGRLGAAAAAMALGYGVQGCWEGALEPAGRMLVWAIDDGGLRGCCTLETHSLEGTRLEGKVPFVGGQGPRLQKWTPSRWPTKHLRPGWEPNAADVPPVLRLDLAMGGPKPLMQDLEQRVVRLLDDVRMLGKERMEHPLRGSAETEARIVRRVNLLAAMGDSCRPLVGKWWTKQLEVADPWRSWAITIALGCLEGELDVLLELLEMLPETAHADAQRAGEALALLPYADPSSILARLAKHQHPIVRAASFVARCRRGEIGWERLLEVLSAPPEPIQAYVALWEAAHLPSPPGGAALDAIDRWIWSQEPTLAWFAVRASTVHASPTAYNWVQTTHPTPVPGQRALADVLGPMRLELLVLVGSGEDSALLQKWLRRTKPTKHTLDVLGRFGNVEAWAYLARHLSDDDLGEPAALALELLFGRIVQGDDRRHAGAWEEAIRELGLDPQRRYRLGKPWSPASFVEEVRRGEVSRAGLEARQLELRARRRGGVYRPLHGLAPEVAASLEATCREWSRVPSAPSGTWSRFA